MVLRNIHIVVVTLIGVTALAFADEHSVKKPVHSSGRTTSTPSRGPAVLSDEQAAADSAEGDKRMVDEVGEAVDQLMLFSEKPALSSMGGEQPGHFGNPNLISMPR
jgi:hypothetical protein